MNILLGALMGLIYAVSPGPVNIETVRRGVLGGFRLGFSTQLGSLFGALFYALLALLGARLVSGHSTASLLLGLAGATLLLSLGWSALRAAWRGRPAAAAAAAAPGRAIRFLPTLPALAPTPASFWAGLAISVVNPSAVAFWLSIGGTALQRFQQHEGLFLAGFFLSVVGWALVLPGLVGRWRAAMGERFARGISWGCGLALVAIALGLGSSTLLR
jgi:threonine/homoserine/homoserine lactone efflux protein